MTSLKFSSAKPYLTPDVDRRVNLQLDNIRRGSDTNILTPLGKKFGPENLLKEWDEQFNSSKSVINDVLFNIEQNQRSKFGPRSISQPWDEIKDEFYEQYNQSTVLLKKDDSVFKPVIKPISFSDALRKMKNSTNSGLPEYVVKSKVKVGYTPSKWNDELSKDYPCLMFRRTQEQRKTRIVWGYPFALTLLATMYFEPLLKFERKFSWRSSLRGPDSTARRMTDIIDKVQNSKGYTVLGVDFSLFDRSAKQPFVSRAINKFSKLFLPSDRLYKDMEVIGYNMTGIGMITPDGVANGEHGLSSGSPGTNTIGSDIQYSIAKDSNLYLNGFEDVNGDDGVYAILESNVEGFFKYFSTLGFNLNKDKSTISRDYVVYLQNLYHKDYRKEGCINGIYPIYRALNRLIHQERWTDLDVFDEGSDYYSLRTISILENCKHHPMFEQFVDFIYKRDKYALAYSEKAISKYIVLTYGSEESRDLIRNQYGQYVRGIADFETVKVISKLKMIKR